MADFLTNEDLKNQKKGKYPALKTIAEIFNVLGYLFIIFGSIGLLYFISETEIYFSVGSFIAGLLIGLPLLAICNLIYLLIDIEYNTRN